MQNLIQENLVYVIEKKINNKNQHNNLHFIFMLFLMKLRQELNYNNLVNKKVKKQMKYYGHQME